MSSKSDYLSNTKVAQKFNVSDPTVGDWIKNAIEGKNNLQIEKYREKYRIIDSPHNEAELFRLSELAKRYKGHGARKVTRVSKEFYERFTTKQQIDFISSLKYKRAVSDKFFYMNPTHWDKYYNSGKAVLVENILEFLNISENYLNYNINNENINLIDLRAKNGKPAESAIKLFRKNFKILKYIGIDISKPLLNLADKNLSKSFPKLEKNFYQKDIEVDNISDIIIESKQLSSEISNIILLIGTISTILDRKSVLKNIQRSMTTEDIFVVTYALDNLNNRGEFNFVKSEDDKNTEGYRLKLLGIDIDKCELKPYFNPEDVSKNRDFILDKDYEIIFKIFNNEVKLDLLKGEEINVWKHYLFTKQEVITELENTGFKVLGMLTNKEQTNIMVYCKLDVSIQKKVL